MPYYFPLILIATVCCSGLWPERLAAQTSERFKRFDRDGDGKLSTAEVNRIPPLKTRLDGADRNRDGYYTIEEIRAHISGGGRPDQARNAVPAFTTTKTHCRNSLAMRLGLACRQRRAPENNFPIATPFVTPLEPVNCLKPFMCPASPTFVKA